MSPVQILEVCGWRLAMVHDMEPEERPIDGTVGILDLATDKLDARIVRLGETEGRRNPGVEYVFSSTTGVQKAE